MLNIRGVTPRCYLSRRAEDHIFRSNREKYRQERPESDWVFRNRVIDSTVVAHMQDEVRRVYNEFAVKLLKRLRGNKLTVGEMSMICGLPPVVMAAMLLEMRTLGIARIVEESNIVMGKWGRHRVESPAVWAVDSLGVRR